MELGDEKVARSDYCTGGSDGLGGFGDSDGNGIGNGISIGFAIYMNGGLVVAGEGVDGIKGYGSVAESEGSCVYSEDILPKINTTVEGNTPDGIKEAYDR